MIEEWKDIEGYEGLYQISNMGRVMSLPRPLKNYRCKAKKILIPSFSNGYFYLRLCGVGNQKRKYIHRLIAAHFIPNPFNLPEVNHKDFNRTNNKIENLEWVSCQDNCLHAIKGGRTTAKINYKKAQEIRKKHKSGLFSQTKLAAEYGVTQACIWYIIKNINWKDESYGR